MYGAFKMVGTPYSHVWLWVPNLKLKMTADEQYEANRKSDPGFVALKVNKPMAVAV